MFAVASMACAGVVEYRRIDVFFSEGFNRQEIGNTTFYCSKLKIYWQIPQYALMGCSDALTTVAALESAYTLAPRTAQSILSGMLYFSTGVASLIGLVIINLSDNIVFVKDASVGSINSRYKPLSTFFFALGIFQVLGLIAFVAVVRWMKRATVVTSESETPRSPRRAGVYDPTSSSPPIIE